jgi:hypothetical protein
MSRLWSGDNNSMAGLEGVADGFFVGAFCGAVVFLFVLAKKD